ncbi:hypothetical protein S245_056130 [Arachis hypogaea]
MNELSKNLMKVLDAHKKDAERVGRMDDEMRQGLALVEACMEIFIQPQHGAPSEERMVPPNVTVTAIDSVVMECTRTPLRHAADAVGSRTDSGGTKIPPKRSGGDTPSSQIFMALGMKGPSFLGL